MQAFQKDLEKFTRLNTQVLGVSSDSIATHNKFKERHNITFPLISDGNNDLRKLYPGGRVTYLVDKNGTIRFVQKGVPDNARLLREIEKLQ